MDHWRTEKTKEFGLRRLQYNNDGNIELQSSHLYHIEEAEDWKDKKKIRETKKKLWFGIPLRKTFSFITLTSFSPGTWVSMRNSQSQRSGQEKCIKPDLDINAQAHLKSKWDFNGSQLFFKYQALMMYKQCTKHCIELFECILELKWN